jgi:AAA family ATP:ADP antiporter
MRRLAIENSHITPGPTVEGPPRSLADRFLGLFTNVNPGEAAGALLLATNIFLLLAVYYLLKTVREALILTEGGAEVKSYSSAGQAALLLLLMPVYSALASRAPRVKLIASVTTFFALNLFLFAALGLSGVKIGVPFFIWVGIFNLLIVAQIWAFANDAYTEEAGKRLFPVIGVGTSLGAIFGAQIAKGMFTRLGPYWVMNIAAVALLASLALTWLANRRVGVSGAAEAVGWSEPLKKGGGFRLIFSDRYLFLIALLVFILNVVNTTGEYILSKFIVERVGQMGLPDAEQENFIGGFYSDYFWWVNVVSFIFQLLLARRLFKWIGVRGTLFVLPLVALIGYGMLFFIPVLAVARLTKIFENSADYSIQNTAQHALFLPTSREAKYKAQATTETFFWRAGDVAQAGLVYFGVSLGLGLTAFTKINLSLTLVWLGVAAMLYHEHRRLTQEK